MMSFTESICTCFKKYATISGRASRAEFWWFQLFLSCTLLIMILIASVLMICSMIQQSQGYHAADDSFITHFSAIMILMFLLQIVSLALWVPDICVMVRRLHDVGHSGFEIFFGLIPFVGAIYCLVLFLLPSEEGDNQYGPNPHTPELSADVQKEEE